MFIQLKQTSYKPTFNIYGKFSDSYVDHVIKTAIVYTDDFCLSNHLCFNLDYKHDHMNNFLVDSEPVVLLLCWRFGLSGGSHTTFTQENIQSYPKPT